jgi:hypothetical protein
VSRSIGSRLPPGCQHGQRAGVGVTKELQNVITWKYMSAKEGRAGRIPLQEKDAVIEAIAGSLPKRREEDKTRSGGSAACHILRRDWPSDVQLPRRSPQNTASTPSSSPLVVLVAQAVPESYSPTSIPHSPRTQSRYRDWIARFDRVTCSSPLLPTRRGFARVGRHRSGWGRRGEDVVNETGS